MEYLRVCLIAGLMSPLSACGDGDLTQAESTRGVVDEAALAQGVAVSLAGSNGSLTVPFTEEVPEVDVDEFQSEMSSAVSLIVASDATQASVNLNAGMPLDDVGGTPAAAGEFTWELDDDRTSATLTFYNEAPNGLTLTSGSGYSATFSISPNDFVESVSAISFGVSVQ